MVVRAREAEAKTIYRAARSRGDTDRTAFRSDCNEQLCRRVLLHNAIHTQRTLSYAAAGCLAAVLVYSSAQERRVIRVYTSIFAVLQ